MHRATRRLDVDTKWLQDYGVRAAKDVMTVEEYHKVRNHLEDKYTRVENSLGQIRRADIEITAAGCPYQMTTSRSN